MARVIGGTDRITAATLNAFTQTGVTKDGKRKLTDGGGLYATRLPSGVVAWRLRFVLDGADGTFAIGTLADYTLEQAREERRKARTLIRAGIDPTRHRRDQRADAAATASLLFRDVAARWFAKNRRAWGEAHYATSLRAFERDVYPVIGDLSIRTIPPKIIGAMVEQILGRASRQTGATPPSLVETTGKILQHVTSVFRFARAKGLCSDNPALDAKELIPKRPKISPRPALLEFESLRQVLRAATEKKAAGKVTPAVYLAHLVVAFTAQRLTNVVQMRWNELDLDGKEFGVPTWTIARADMKEKAYEDAHIVFLGPTIVSELRAWKTATRGTGRVFFSAAKQREHIGLEAVEKLYRETLGLAGTHCPQGWRSSFSTLARESKLFTDDAIEIALDHVHAPATIRAYDRGDRKRHRIRLAAWWDSRLNPPPAEVTPSTEAPLGA